jgi:hypothetical protein
LPPQQKSIPYFSNVRADEGFAATISLTVSLAVTVIVFSYRFLVSARMPSGYGE